MSDKTNPQFKKGICNACIIHTEDDEKRCEACRSQNIVPKYDPDSSDVAWNYYQFIYHNTSIDILKNYIGEPCKCKKRKRLLQL